jgi:transcriptional regulator GlxA family with amidase domain
VIFLALPELEILDLAGPLQAFTEANRQTKRYDVVTAATRPSVTTEQGVTLAGLPPLPEAGEGTLIIVPGMPYTATLHLDRDAVRWLARSHARGAAVASVCTGSFALGEAGLLDGRRCTTHWSRVDMLQRRFPRARVLDDRLFVSDGSIMTSAGIASGIDMALAMIESDHGPALAAAIAREMVVYIRRDGAQRQGSVYLDHRTHLHPGVHKAQDWLLAHPEKKASIAALADVAGMSARNLTRVFRKATGISINDYTTKVRLELARSLLRDPGASVEGVARRCGFAGARQLRRLWTAHYGVPPSTARSGVPPSAERSSANE